MSNKFTGFHHGTRHVWTNTILTMETDVVFSRDICITDVSWVGYQANAYFAIADASTRRILAYADAPRGDVKTRLTVVGGGRLVLKGNTTYIFSRWHTSHGDIGWGNGVPNGNVVIGNGITARFTHQRGSLSVPYHYNHHSTNRHPAHRAVLFPRDNSRNVEFNIYYSAIPYFWWEEVIVNPSTPASMTGPTDAQVGRIASVSWAGVPLPAQPNGVALPDPKVYYEVDFFDGSSWINVASKTTATSLAYTVPRMPDRQNAQFRVRAFIEAYGAKYYGGYRSSANIRVTNNQAPTVPHPFSFPTTSSTLTIGRSHTILWGVGYDADGDTVQYDLDYFNGLTWTAVLRNSLSTNRTFHVPDGPETALARFRVRAYDGKEYSDWRYSPEFRVARNIVPNTPKPFSYPLPDEMRYVEQNYRVEWGAVEAVEQHDIIRYEVQFRPRLMDNWTTIRAIGHTDARQNFMTHSIPNVQDSANPQYRVRAYDGLDYGDWTESSFFKITGNRVTNTKGFNEELKSRYAVNQEIRLTWSEGSAVRGSQVLYDFEIFDGFKWHEVMYDMIDTSIIFRIPKMSDTTNARFRIRAKTRYDFGGYVYSEWLETRPFTVISFFRYDNIVLPYPNDVQKKENVDYLRQLVNEMRTINEIPPVLFTDEIIIRYDTIIKYVHFDEIERGILDCYETNPNGKFNNTRTETELREIKQYEHQQELLMDLPQRLTNILRALMNI